MSASVTAARTWMRQQLRWLGVEDEVSARAQQLVTELAANVVQHTGSSSFQVRMAVGPVLEAAVHDDDPTRPQPRHPRSTDVDVGGRGLVLVEALSDAWGTRAVPTGKWVWFRLDRPAAPSRTDGRGDIDTVTAADLRPLN